MRFSTQSLVLLGGALVATMCLISPRHTTAEEVQPVARSPRDMNTRFDLGIPTPSLRLQDDPYTGITARQLQQYLNDVVEFSRQSKRDGLKLWGRISGTVYERRTAEYVRRRFEALGMKNIEERSFDRIPQWWPEDWEVSVIGGSSSGAPPQDRPLESAFPLRWLDAPRPFRQLCWLGLFPS